MYQFFSRPDGYIGTTGHLRCAVVERRIPGAPAFMRGLRALFMSDLHALDRTADADMDALADAILAAKPDILLLGGDYADQPQPCRRLFAHLRRVAAPLGAYGVVGNNDREAFPNLGVLRDVMGKAGFQLLVNRSVSLRVGGGRLIVAGLDEYKLGRPDARGLYPAAPDPNRFRLLLSHYPIAVEPMPDLMLSGHTHGGQFNLLGVNPYTVGFERLLCRHPARFIAGLHDYGGGQMLVSKGVGASRIPLRVGVRPEIELLVFES